MYIQANECTWLYCLLITDSGLQIPMKKDLKIL